MRVGWTGRLRGGVTTAAVLPSAFMAALLISASSPIATDPLADSTAGAATSHVASHAPAAGSDAAAAPTAGLNIDISAGSVGTLVGAEALLLAVGAGVIVVARRRHRLDEA